ncbi:hypothetical protein BDU57DRAFT_594566 [Ampelomyces quisqualis]|uniref:Uncharacterized protein n=1 Tax=Ampelomyces quisqualis TaxID=50730 RepID=A0A6A5QUK3_AMPQU|nr:hypothetical protein BDU57DRAFT_594566 [Ampelomyces quisqualis]
MTCAAADGSGAAHLKSDPIPRRLDSWARNSAHADPSAAPFSLAGLSGSENATCCTAQQARTSLSGCLRTAKPEAESTRPPGPPPTWDKTCATSWPNDIAPHLPGPLVTAAPGNNTPYLPSSAKEDRRSTIGEARPATENMSTTFE